ncbi:hypothetical protein F5141DRAFT_1260506 [Pisolithus sp. B1]|nr:hypothetical protein F5141DRAFT_1260506 [Pisolithus sp. B1]
MASSTEKQNQATREDILAHDVPLTWLNNSPLGVVATIFLDVWNVTGIKASGLPAKVGFFSGLFYIRVKSGGVAKRTRTAKYTKNGGDFVAMWDENIIFSAPESSKVQIEVFARRFFFSYKLIKKTESKESLADLLVHADTPVELELLEEGRAAGRLIFRICRNDPGVGNTNLESFTSPPTSPISLPSPTSHTSPHDAPPSTSGE